MNSSLSKILIVDDLEANRDTLKRLLEKVGAELFEAASCAEALHQILKHKFDLILLDVRMPKVNGFETAEIIRKLQITHKTPIMFLTIDNNPVSVDKGYRSGGVDYITRPFDEALLLEKIRVLMEFSSGQK